MPDQELQVTLPLLKVLRAMLDAPLQPQYGLELMRVAGLKSGTLYPVLARLERAGWIKGEWEAAGDGLGRPPRKFYKLSEDGMSLARQALAEAYMSLGVRQATHPSTAPRPAGGLA